MIIYLVITLLSDTVAALFPGISKDSRLIGYTKMARQPS